MEFENLLFEQKEKLGIVRINRPEKKNALHFDLLRQIKGLFEILKSKNDLEIIILTGYKDANTSFFSSGIDLDDLQGLNNENHSRDDLSQNIAELQSAVHSIEVVGKVVIAQITGFCFGSALEIALACDFIISSPESKFGLLETKYGIIPDLGGTFRLLRRVGYQYAKQLIMLAEIITAQEALRIGMINWVIELAEIEEKTKKVVDQISLNQIKAVLTAKELIDQIHPIDRVEASLFEREAQLKLISK